MENEEMFQGENIVETCFRYMFGGKYRPLSGVEAEEVLHSIRSEGKVDLTLCLGDSYQKVDCDGKGAMRNLQLLLSHDCSSSASEDNGSVLTHRSFWHINSGRRSRLEVYLTRMPFKKEKDLHHMYIAIDYEG